jgi:DNA (cytosine-5)-methyltransferase 1
MKYLSVCSGVEAASVAWEGLGWQPVAFAEFDKFPSAVLAHRFPNVPNYGDITKFKEWPDHEIDLLVGGTPCQSFSVAGLRRGLEDPRGNLMLTFVAIAARYKPRWLVWENVPGVLSSGRGRDFGSLLGALAELGYGFAWRVLDAQFYGVPQRRRRVFLVAHLGDERRAREVLLVADGVRGDLAASEPAREAAAGDHAAGARGPSWPNPEVAPALTAKMAKGTGGPAGDECQNLVLVPFRKSRRAQSVNDCETWVPDEVANTVTVFDVGEVRTTQAVVEVPTYCLDEYNQSAHHEVSYPLRTAQGDGIPKVNTQDWRVRRLTPRECERLQGFPDDWTLVPYRGKEASDGARYKAMGNSMAVPVMRWIGERIALVDRH